MLNIVLFGPPGAGKGTQSERLVRQYDLVHLSTGDVFRSNIKGETELGKLAQRYMDEGNLVPDEVTIKMLEEEVNKHPDAAGFIFDGFPRTIPQANALDDFLASKESEVDMMLSLEVDEKELRSRLKERAEISNRPDDAKPEVIQKRIDVYREETEPVKEYYRKRDKLAEVNGVGSIDGVTQRLFQMVDQKAP